MHCILNTDCTNRILVMVQVFYRIAWSLQLLVTPDYQTLERTLIRWPNGSLNGHILPPQCHHMTLKDFVVSPPGWTPMRCSYVVLMMYEYEVPGGTLNLSSTKLPRPWSPWGSSSSRKNPHGRTDNWAWDFMISSQKLWPLDHEAGDYLYCKSVDICFSEVIIVCADVSSLKWNTNFVISLGVWVVNVVFMWGIIYARHRNMWTPYSKLLGLTGKLMKGERGTYFLILYHWNFVCSWHNT
jgi:hypothetical protein